MNGPLYLHAFLVETVPGSGLWNYSCTFTPVEGQLDYPWPGGSGNADTDASHALVTWGGILQTPDTDYVILADRFRLTPPAPSSEQAAMGEVFTVRVIRA